MSTSKKDRLSREEKLRELVRASVTESIRDALGDSAMKALTYYVQPDLLISSPREFHQTLEKIIKDATPTLEYLIVKDLSERLGVQPRLGASDLEGIIQMAKEAMLDGYGGSSEW
ncbi:MAG: hypothetical protein ABSB56_08150 [Nitrososphaerales archaeon]|jgi:hypothetical protein